MDADLFTTLHFCYIQYPILALIHGFLVPHIPDVRTKVFCLTQAVNLAAPSFCLAFLLFPPSFLLCPFRDLRIRRTRIQRIHSISFSSLLLRGLRIRDVRIKRRLVVTGRRVVRPRLGVLVGIGVDLRAVLLCVAVRVRMALGILVLLRWPGGTSGKGANGALRFYMVAQRGLHCAWQPKDI